MYTIHKYTVVHTAQHIVCVGASECSYSVYLFCIVADKQANIWFQMICNYS